MRNKFLLSIAALVLVAMAASAHGQDVNAGVSISDGQVKGFYVAIGKYFNMPQRAITVVREKRIPDEELPVVFFIARRANVRPAAVIELRNAGQSWMDITLHFGLSPEIYYVEYQGEPAPPYGHAYGYFRKHPRAEWRDIRFDDDDIVNLVNLRFMCDQYKLPPEEIMRWRGDHRSFVLVNDDAIKAKKQYSQNEQGQDKDNQGKHGHGKGKGHKHD